MVAINREQLKDSIDRGVVKVVEVLDEKYYKKFHLPGAINVPLGEDFAERIEKAIPEKRTPVVVYCMDAECQASPEAAQRMGELGYVDVHDYEAGKLDWKEAGLPVED